MANQIWLCDEKEIKIIYTEASACSPSELALSLFSKIKHPLKCKMMEEVLEQSIRVTEDRGTWETHREKKSAASIQHSSILITQMRLLCKKGLGHDKTQCHVC